MVRDIRIADYDYPLPDSLIARHPCEPRDACRLLVRHLTGRWRTTDSASCPDCSLTTR